MLRRAWRSFVDCLFPVYCVECEREGEWWCRECRPVKLVKPNFFVTDPPLNGAFFIFRYHHNNAVSRLIQQFKYQQGHAMSELWRDTVPLSIPIEIRDAEVVPVPLFSHRARERGYNQAEIIADSLATQWNLKLDKKLLERVRATKQQAKLSKIERQENVQAAFGVGSGDRVPECVLLVDDVYTTGATMTECARVLKEAGAKRVFGYVLARGE